MSDFIVSDLLPVFNGITWSFNYVILPICYFLGNIGNCLNLVVFLQRSSRSNACLLYFLSTSVANVIILNFGLTLRLLRGIWSIDPALRSLWFCRWRTYLSGNLFLIYRLSVLFACFDRMCASSRNAWLRAISRPQMAYRLIALIWLFCSAYWSPALALQTIVYGQCLTPPDSPYSTFMTVSTLAQSLLIPLGMIVCGWFTSVHLRAMQVRVAPAPHNDGHDERQVVGKYITMLVVQVITDGLCNVLYPIYLIYNLIYPPPQNARITLISGFLINISFTLPYLNFSAAFYLHTLSSPSFRRKLIRLSQRIPWVRRWMPIELDHHHTRTLMMSTVRAHHTAVWDERTHAK